MFVEVPAPPCKTSTSNWSLNCPFATSRHAWRIAGPVPGGSSPNESLVRQAACLIRARTEIKSGQAPIGVPVSGKFATDLAVCAPYSASAGTRTSPKLSYSTRNDRASGSSSTEPTQDVRAKQAETSTAAPNGKDETPTAALLCLPESPRMATSRSDAPFITRG